MNKYCIIVAGGKGARMGSEIPKQFLLLGDKPVLMHTMEKFYNTDSSIKLILVLPANQFSYWESLCKEYKFDLSYQLVEGGNTRFHSVKNALDTIQEDGLVAVHDGVRPFVNHRVIGEAYELVEKKNAVVPVIPVYETIREVNKDTNCTVDREKYKLVQTPQLFTISLLKLAYQQTFREDFTDDASVVEALGTTISLIEGNRENIKITTPFDIKIATALIDV